VTGVWIWWRKRERKARNSEAPRESPRGGVILGSEGVSRI
jgi:hypothetical protein